MSSPTLTKAMTPKNRAANHFQHLRMNNTARPMMLEQGRWRQERRQTRRPPRDHDTRHRPPHPPLKSRPRHHSRSAPPQSSPWCQGPCTAASSRPTARRRCGPRPRPDPARASRHLSERPRRHHPKDRAELQQSPPATARWKEKGREWRLLGFATRVVRGGDVGAFWVGGFFLDSPNTYRIQLM
jgi:hypothetical protein